MKHTCYNEQRERGNFSFPVEYHYVTNHHPRFNMPYHWHIQYEIIHILQGSFIIGIDEEEITAKAGDILFINDGSVHGGKVFSDDTIYECMVFDRKMFQTTIGNQDIMQAFFEHRILPNSYYTDELKQIHSIVLSMFAALKAKTSGYEYIVHGSLFTLLGLIIEHHLYHEPVTAISGSNQRNINKLKKTFKLIENSYSEQLTLEELAEAAGLSPKYFCRFFKQMTNKTPISYLNYYRVESVCLKLVAEPDIPLIDIAYECGFNDFSYFIKTFRKYKGTTPKKYLTEYQKLKA